MILSTNLHMSFPCDSLFHSPHRPYILCKYISSFSGLFPCAPCPPPPHEIFHTLQNQIVDQSRSESFGR